MHPIHPDDLFLFVKLRNALQIGFPFERCLKAREKSSERNK